MTIKSRELGRLSVDCGDVVCFSIDSIIQLAENNGFDDDVERFIKKWKGVECNFHADGGYGVDQVTAVNQNGSTYDVIIIGADMSEIKRFLLTSEEEFSEFASKHPKYKEVGEGKEFNHGIFSEIADEYKWSLMKNQTNLQAEPTKLLDNVNFDAEYAAMVDKNKPKEGV